MLEWLERTWVCCSELRGVRRVAFFVSAALLSFVVFAILININTSNYNERAKFSEMVYGEAYRPYVKRMLMPGSIQLVRKVLPDRLEDSVTAWGVEQPFFKWLFAERGWELEFFMDYLIFAILAYLCILGYTYAIRYLAAAVLRANAGFFSWIALLSLFLLPPFFPFNYIYDMPALFLTTLALALLARRKWVAYLLVYGLACMNKETTVLLTAVFALYYFPRPLFKNVRYWMLLVLQGLIFIGIQVLVLVLFRDNPGGHTENYLLPHLRQLLRAYSFSKAFTTVAVLLLVFNRWGEKPLVLRYASLMFIPLYVLFVPYGYMGEIRVFYEVFPVVLLLAAQSVAHLLGGEVTVREDLQRAV
ncbi:MAG: hypothetical protein KJ626_14170 [Verrucomicrobia bacterium]|nr:hypothetical protein [Verrucomicrobiota bacterium]